MCTVKCCQYQSFCFTNFLCAVFASLKFCKLYLWVHKCYTAFCKLVHIKKAICFFVVMQSSLEAFSKSVIKCYESDRQPFSKSRT